MQSPEYIGLSYEQAFLNGLNVAQLRENLFFTESLILFFFKFSLNVRSVFKTLFYLWTVT